MACPLGILREALVGMFRADLTEAVMGEVLTHGLTLHHLSVTNLIKIDFKLFPSCMFVYIRHFIIVIFVFVVVFLVG